MQQGSGEFRRRSGRRQVRFNRVPEKVPEKLLGSLGAKPSQVQRVPGKVARRFWASLVQGEISSTGCNRVPEKVPEKVWEALAQSQVRFNKVPEKVPEKVPGGFGAEQGQVQ